MDYNCQGGTDCCTQANCCEQASCQLIFNFNAKSICFPTLNCESILNFNSRFLSKQYFSVSSWQFLLLFELMIFIVSSWQSFFLRITSSLQVLAVPAVARMSPVVKQFSPSSVSLHTIASHSLTETGACLFLPFLCQFPKPICSSLSEWDGQPLYSFSCHYLDIGQHMDTIFKIANNILETQE